MGQHSPHSIALSTGTASESGHVCHLPGRGFPNVTGCSDPATPGSLPALAEMGLCVYIPPFFSWTSSFPVPSRSSCCSVSGRPEKEHREHSSIRTQTTEVCEGSSLCSPVEADWPRQQVLLVTMEPHDYRSLMPCLSKEYKSHHSVYEHNDVYYGETV